MELPFRQMGPFRWVLVTESVILVDDEFFIRTSRVFAGEFAESFGLCQLSKPQSLDLRKGV